MKRIIKIGNKEYEMKSSAYTQFKYKNDTGRKLLEDLQNLTQLQDKKESEMIASIDDLGNISAEHIPAFFRKEHHCNGAHRQQEDHA